MKDEGEKGKREKEVPGKVKKFWPPKGGLLN